jgi:hypothetical protein
MIGDVTLYRVKAWHEQETDDEIPSELGRYIEPLAGKLGIAALGYRGEGLVLLVLRGFNENGEPRFNSHGVPRDLLEIADSFMETYGK